MDSLSPDQQKAWNEAHERVTHFLDSFSLGDRAHVSQIALNLLGKAKQTYSTDSSRTPTSLTMEEAQKLLVSWLATNLDEKDRAPSHIMADGCIALLLSRVFQTAPESFMAGPLPEELRHALREKLLIAGPDLNISRMTPRHLDYGPMLGLAQQTWHRGDMKAFLVAVFFWAGIYAVFYWWLSNY